MNNYDEWCSLVGYLTNGNICLMEIGKYQFDTSAQNLVFVIRNAFLLDLIHRTSHIDNEKRSKRFKRFQKQISSN